MHNKHCRPARAGGGQKESQQQIITVLPCLRDAVRQELPSCPILISFAVTIKICSLNSASINVFSSFKFI
jgi:hypothetical protein